MPTVESGMLTVALGWLESLPREVLWQCPDAAVLYPWFVLLNGRFREAVQAAQEIAARFPDLPPAQAGLLSGMLAWMPQVQGQPMDLARLKEAHAHSSGRYPYFSPLLLLAIGQAQREAGDLRGAAESFTRGAEQAEATGSIVSALILRNNLAFLLHETGEREAALSICQEAIEQNSDAEGVPGLLASIPLIAYGFMLCESGRLDEAQSNLTLGLNLTRRMGMYDILAMPANHSLLQILVDQGRYADGLALIKEIRKRAQKAGLTLAVREADLREAALHLTAGDPAPAIRWAQANPLPEHAAWNPIRANSVLMHARVLGVTGQVEAAESLMQAQLEAMQAWGMSCYWIRASVELANILAHAGKHKRAAEILGPAIEAAEPIDYRQAFVRWAVPLAPVFNLLRPVLSAQSLRFVTSICSGPAAAPSSPALVEALTPREMDVLRLAASGMSNADIANHLYLTTGTVKWFLNQIYGKLEVNRRTEAVAKARSLGLL